MMIMVMGMIQMTLVLPQVKQGLATRGPYVGGGFCLALPLQPTS